MHLQSQPDEEDDEDSDVQKKLMALPSVPLEPDNQTLNEKLNDASESLEPLQQSNPSPLSTVVSDKKRCTESRHESQLSEDGDFEVSNSTSSSSQLALAKRRRGDDGCIENGERGGILDLIAPNSDGGETKHTSSTETDLQSKPLDKHSNGFRNGLVHAQSAEPSHPNESYESLLKEEIKTHLDAAWATYRKFAELVTLDDGESDFDTDDDDDSENDTKLKSIGPTNGSGKIIAMANGNAEKATATSSLSAPAKPRPQPVEDETHPQPAEEPIIAVEPPPPPIEQPTGQSTTETKQNDDG